MVQILPGYPKRSDDSPGIILLVFYLRLPRGIFDSSIVPEIVLSKIVMDHKENIQTSIGGEILSADPLSSDTEQLNGKKSDKENDGKLKPPKVIIGASVGVAAILIGCRKTGRYIFL